MPNAGDKVYRVVRRQSTELVLEEHTFLSASGSGATWLLQQGGVPEKWRAAFAFSLSPQAAWEASLQWLEHEQQVLKEKQIAMVTEAFDLESLVALSTREIQKLKEAQDG